MIVGNENMLGATGDEKQKQDAGAILEGSANLVNAFGNIYGTWLAAKTGQQYVPVGGVVGAELPMDEDPEEQRKRKRNTTIIVVGLGLVAISALLYFTLKKD